MKEGKEKKRKFERRKRRFFYSFSLSFVFF